MENYVKLPDPPTPPHLSYIKEGYDPCCPKCHSSVTKLGLILVECVCIHPECGYMFEKWFWE